MTRDAREIAREIVRKWTGNAPDGARPPKVLPTFQETLAGAIAAAIEKDRAEREAWLPIETAPRDGTKIDLLYPYPRGRTINCYWDGELGGWIWRTPTWGSGHVLLPESEWKFSCYPNMEPTHWRPLPSPPSEAARKAWRHV